MSFFDHVVAFKEKPKLNVEDRLKISQVAFCCLPLNLEGIFHPFPLPKHPKLHVAKLSESNRLVLVPLHKQMPLWGYQLDVQFYLFKIRVSKLFARVRLGVTPIVYAKKPSFDTCKFSYCTCLSHCWCLPVRFKSKMKFCDSCFSALRPYSLMISRMVGNGGNLMMPKRLYLYSCKIKFSWFILLTRLTRGYDQQ